MTRSKLTKTVIGLCLGLVFLNGCGESDPIPEPPIRAIKPFYVSELAGGNVRTFSGTIAASGTSTLSFAVGGTVKLINVNAGDQVNAGQTLAELDSAPYEIDVEAATAQLNSARAALATEKSNLTRQKDLFDRGWVAKAAYDQAVLSFESAKEDLNYAQSKLSSANRNLRNTALKAPYDGIIASRTADPFTEITPGSPLFEINVKGALDVVISVPDKIVSRFAIGQPVIVNSAQITNCGCRGRITEIGSVSGAANAVVVKATLNDPPTDLLPGVTTEVSVTLAKTEGVNGYLIPLNAIAASSGDRSGVIFIFDPETKTVKRSKIKGLAGQDNMVQITEGVEVGDIIAAAGVSFLRDGQKVKLMGE